MSMAIRWEQVLLATTLFYTTVLGLSALSNHLYHHHYLNAHDGTWCMTLDSNNMPLYLYGKTQCGID